VQQKKECQRELWNEVYMYLEANLHSKHAVVTGTPGIGKIRSMTYFLRLLLQKGKTVIFEARKEQKAFAFIPPSGHQRTSKYKVWRCDLSSFVPSSCTVLMNSNHYYLIDPDLPAQIVSVFAHTVLAASTERAHFKEFQKVAIKWLMPIWRKDELKVLQNYIKIEGATLDDNEFETRFMNFGGIFRYIYTGCIKCLQYYDDLKNSVARLEFEILMKALSPHGVDVDAEQGAPNMVFVYDILAIPTTFHSITFKYLKVSGNHRIEFASETTRRLVALKFWKEILDALNPNSQRMEDSST
jgi:hypothetical protein